MKQDKEVWRSREFERVIAFSFKPKDEKKEKIFVPNAPKKKGERNVCK